MTTAAVSAKADAESASDSVLYEKGQEYQFPSGVRVRITAIVPDFDSGDVIVVLASYCPHDCVSDFTVSEFRAMNPVLIEGGV
ncbi:MAG: hypothetical protein WBP40_00070 [Candidatus Moraniibacteriota bacterium]